MRQALVPTGIRALDVFLNGGLPVGYTTLLLAPSGAGAEIFAKQFASGTAAEPTVYITTDEPASDVLATAEVGGWPFDHVRIEDVQSQFAEQMLTVQRQMRKQSGRSSGARRTFDPRDLMEAGADADFVHERRPRPATPAKEPEEIPQHHDYLGALLDPYSSGPVPGRVVVHSLDFYLNLYPVEKVVAALTATKAANARSRGQLLWVLAQGAHGVTTERRLELLADCLIELEMTRKGTTFERFCVVKKVKNRSDGVGVSTYEIGPHGFHLETLERIV